MSVKKTNSDKKNKVNVIIKQSLFDNLPSESSFKNKKLISNNSKKKKDKNFNTISDLLISRPKQEVNKYISREFQAFGCHMASILGDSAHTSLYIKLAKTYPRGLLEQALAFVSDADHARSKAKLFMWKLEQLKQDKKLKF